MDRRGLRRIALGAVALLVTACVREAPTVQYYDFRMAGQPVGFFEISEEPALIRMNARMVMHGRRYENPFEVRLRDGRPVECRVGDAPWRAVPDGVYPTAAYPLVLRDGLTSYRAIEEGSGEISERTLSREGDEVVERSGGQVVRRFRMDGDAIVAIHWGGPAVSTRCASRSEAVRGTPFSDEGAAAH